MLQEGEVERLGSARTIKVDVRVIAATNKDLEAEIEKGDLPRGSLLPPERHPDPGAAAARPARGHPGAGPALRRSLQPREQPPAAALHAGRARVHAEGALEGERPRAEEHRRAAADHDARRQRSTSTICATSSALETEAGAVDAGAGRERPRRPGTLREFKESAERKFLVEKLRENAWNISKTAEVIGTPRSNLYKKLEQYAITPGELTARSSSRCRMRQKIVGFSIRRQTLTPDDRRRRRSLAERGSKARGKSELRRAVRRVTPGRGNSKDSGTENIPLRRSAS